MVRRVSILLLLTLSLAACSLPSINAFTTEEAQPTTIPPAVEAPPIGEIVAPTLPAEPTSEVEALPGEPEPLSPPADTQETAESVLPDKEIVADSVPPVDGIDDLDRISAATPLDRDQVALASALRGGTFAEVARTEPLAVQVGDVETFYVSDMFNNTNVEVSARLRYAGPVVLLYVDTTVDLFVRQEDVERAAKEFEEEIYPRNRALFGSENIPGVDGDPRLTILNTVLWGAGGYFSSGDAVVREVNRFSNEREMFVIGINSYPIGSDSYGSVLAHEFQHMIHWHQQRRSPAWFDEGMSTLAEDLNGYVSHNTAMLHLSAPDIQLTTWGSTSAQTGQHYGTSQLFMRYIYDQYTQDSGLSELIRANAGNDHMAFVPLAQRVRPEITSFADIVADWAVANLLNDPTIDNGRYAYALLPGTVSPQQIGFGQREGSVSQFGAHYLNLPPGPLTLEFDGSDRVNLVGATPQSGQFAWWSNRGDQSVSTLTRAFDLSAVETATLEFSLWHEIELDWDYAYVTVSNDDGSTWTALPGLTTTKSDPQGNNIGGIGLTGVSGAPGAKTDSGVTGEWLEERFDLSAYAGQQIQVRFWLIHDDAYNAAGMLIDNIRIPEIGFSDDVESGDGNWNAVGFVRTTGILPQQWMLRLVRQNEGGTTVEPIETDADGRASLYLAPNETGTIVILGSTPHTTQKADYILTVREP